MPLTPQTTQPNIVREPLRWLFIANFADGTSIAQDQDDTCTTRDDGTGSAFTDVLAREDALTSFELVRVDSDEVVTVDLVHGTFVVNGTPICLHNQGFDPTRYKLKLVYFRENLVQQEVRGAVQADGTVQNEAVGEPRHFVNRYFIGWQTTVNSKNKQVTLAVG